MAGYQSFLAVWLGGGGVPGVILPPVLRPPGIYLPDWGQEILQAELADRTRAGDIYVRERPAGPLPAMDWGQIILNRRMRR